MKSKVFKNVWVVFSALLDAKEVFQAPRLLVGATVGHLPSPEVSSVKALVLKAFGLLVVHSG